MLIPGSGLPSPSDGEPTPPIPCQRRGRAKSVHGFLTVLWLGLMTSDGEAWANTLLSEQDFYADLPQVLTASRLVQPLMDAPNAMTVIDRQLIQSYGFRDLAEVFRLVPGFQVHLVNGYFRAVSHGLSDQYARRMQVLVDGRSIYMPFFGGVRWDALPLVLDDIERIEVSRGPNAATYGANAFTGIINIITRHPQDVPRHGMTARVGDHGIGDVSYRLGGGQTDHQYRMTVGWTADTGFSQQHDSTRAPLFNYRGDWYLGEYGSLSAQLGYVGGTRQAGFAQVVEDQPHDQHVRSHYQQLNWQQLFVGGASLDVRLAHSLLDTREDVITLGDTYSVPPFTLTTAPYRFDYDVWSERWDLEAQYRQEHTANIRSVLGLALHRDAVRSARVFGDIDDRVSRSVNLFGHLEWRLAKEWLINTGAMLESHDIGGDSVSPRVSLHWQPSPEHGFRLGLSRAIRNPVQVEEGARWTLPFLVVGADAPLPVPFIYSFAYITSSGGLESEEVSSRELAYLGVWPDRGLQLDLRLFKDSYRNLIGILGTAGSQDRDFANTEQAELWGMDGQLRWSWSHQGRVLLNLAYTHSRADFITEHYDRTTPDWQFGLLASQRLSMGLDVSLGYYWTSPMEVVGASPIKSSRRLDLRLAWPLEAPGRKGEVALVLQGLAGAYQEFDDNDYNTYDGRAYLMVKTEF